MLSRAVGHIGAQRESVRGQPTQVFVGDDGSVAFEVRTNVFRPTGESIAERTRYLVFDAAAVRAAEEKAPSQPPLRPGPAYAGDPPRVIFDVGIGRLIPSNPTARDAEVADLPEPLRPGRRVFESPRGGKLERLPGDAMTEAYPAGTVPLFGRPRLVSLRARTRDRRDPAGAVAAGALLVPAVVADVVTFPVQFPVFLYVYGTYFGRPGAPAWTKPFMTPAPNWPVD